MATVRLYRHLHYVRCARWHRGLDWPLLRIPAPRHHVEREFNGCAGAGCALD